MRAINVEQGSYEWHCARQGIVTGTTLSSALGTPKVQATLRYKLISERMTEPQIDDINTPAISRGREIEPLARKAIAAKLCIDIAETGMLVSDDIPGFGLSPDGVILSGSDVVGGVEIKCPDSKKHIEYVINGELPKEYADQVKAPFLLSDQIQFWYFGSFDDRNYERPLFLIKITRDHFTTIEDDRKKLKEFIQSISDAHSALTF